MLVGPAWAFGLLFVFFLGCAVTYVILDQVAKRGKGNPRSYRDTLKRVGPSHPTEDGIEKVSLVGGGIAVVLVIILMIAAPSEWRTAVWYVLIALGFLFGLLTFVLLGSESSSKVETRYRPTDTQARQESERDRKKRQAEHQANVYEERRKQQELERERQEHRAEYQARVYETQRKQAQVGAIKDDLYSLFGLADDNSHKRGELLKGVLNSYFKVNDIPVREAFELVEQEGERDVELIDGVVAIDGCLYLVEMRWCKEPLGAQEVTPYLGRVFDRGYPGGILMTNSNFTQPAITSCKGALSRSIVVFCELEEIVALLEGNGSLKDFLKAKIAAAVVDKNPLSKPLNHARGVQVGRGSPTSD